MPNISNNKDRPSYLPLVKCLVLCLLAAIIAGCQISPGTPQASSTPTLKSQTTTTPFTTTPPSNETGPSLSEEQVLSIPTPAPTATPSQLDNAVEMLSQRAGIDDLTIFGMNGENITNLMISLLIVLLGGILGGLIVNAASWLATQTSPKFDDRLIAAIQKQVKWLIALIFLQFATLRLVFLSPESKHWLNLIYFALFVLVITTLIWKLFDYVLDGAPLRVSSPHHRNLLVAFTPLLRRTAQFALYLIGLAVILQNFGVNLSALLALLGLGGLAISLAAKQTLEDIISGFIILIDRPFQTGDRIKIDSMDTWGNVEIIGSRTTRIRTLDNRLVIVPNSTIVNNKVETYTSTNPDYQVVLPLGIGYGSDIDQVLEIIKQAIMSVSGVMESKPPIVDFLEFGDSAMNFRAVYWLENYTDLSPRTQVNKAITQALLAANIDMPFTTYDINLAYKEPPQAPQGAQTQ